MRLLARREHSSAELRRKLLARGYPADLIDPVLEELAAHNQLNESRYGEEFVHSRVTRGQGPLKIRVELRQRGLSGSQIEQALASAGVHWGRLAVDVRTKRFGAAKPRDFSERAKQGRFLESRGFSSEHIRSALGEDDPD